MVAYNLERVKVASHSFAASVVSEMQDRKRYGLPFEIQHRPAERELGKSIFSLEEGIRIYPERLTSCRVQSSHRCEGSSSASLYFDIATTPHDTLSSHHRPPPSARAREQKRDIVIEIENEQ